MRDQQKICREEWFKEHEAHYLSEDPTIIEWKNPKSWNYGCHFIIHSQWLCVVGDLGEAVYAWGQTLDLKFLGQINFDYFMGKCRASPSGSRFRQWSSRAALESLQNRLLHESFSDHEKAFIVSISAGTPKDEFDDMLRAAYYDGGFNSDFAASVSECGYIPDVQCVGHFVGLQMAIKQLTNETKA